VTDVKAVLTNALSLIVVTLLGMVTDVKVLFVANALSPILLTGSPRYEAGMIMCCALAVPCDTEYAVLLSIKSNFSPGVPV
jgi:hypothetical protein